MFDWLIPLLMVLAALPYLVLPLLIKANLSMASRPHFHLIALKLLPPDCASFFAEKLDELRRLGFNELAVLECPSAGSNVKNYLLLMANQNEKILALLTAVIGIVESGDEGEAVSERKNNPRPQTFYLELVTKFASGEQVSSMNSTELSSFPARENTTILQVPQVQDSEKLLRFHLRALEDLKAGKEPVLPRSEDWAAFTQSEISTHYDWVEKNTGLLILDKENENYRPSWLGAYKLTWMEMWPLKEIRRTLMKARAKKLERRYMV